MSIPILLLSLFSLQMAFVEAIEPFPQSVMQTSHMSRCVSILKTVLCSCHLHLIAQLGNGMKWRCPLALEAGCSPCEPADLFQPPPFSPCQRLEADSIGLLSMLLVCILLCSLCSLLSNKSTITMSPFQRASDQTMVCHLAPLPRCTSFFHHSLESLLQSIVRPLQCINSKR